MVFVLFVCSNGMAQDESELDSAGFAQIKFELEAYNFGDINQGEKVEKTFNFTNTGNMPLVLNNVLSTCGCTAPEWPKDPLKPGSQGE